MDSFDRQILAVLKDGRSVGFHQILQKVTFSHNALRLHLASLEREGMIVKAETAENSPGRPSFTYALPPNIRQRVDLVVTKPYTTIVSLTVQKLRHLCRFEKGGYCKKIRNKCVPQNCLQIPKGQ
jgi:predicted ArsR family transcriptional regulator